MHQGRPFQVEIDRENGNKMVTGLSKESSPKVRLTFKNTRSNKMPKIDSSRTWSPVL